MNLGSENPADTAMSIAALMAQLCQIYQKQLPKMLPTELMQMSHSFDLFWQIYAKQMQNPMRMIELQQKSANDFAHIFSTFSEQNSTVREEERVFRNEAWRENVYFQFIKNVYYALKNYADEWLLSLDDLDPRTKQQLHFYVNNILSFISPTNALWSNPEVIQATVESGGNNLVRGFRNYLEDLVLNNGQPNVRMTDMKAFEVGKNIAVTPGKVVFQNDLMQLIQYEPATKDVYKTPILFVPPWINKYYVLDLSPENSLVKWLVEQGYTVFMISWVNPEAELSHKRFDDYMLEGPAQALKVITDKIGCEDVHSVGYCIGGTLLACTLAYLQSRNIQKIKSSTFFMSLLNFANPGELGIFFDEAQFETLEKLMQSEGYLNGHLLDIAFNALRPDDLVWPYYINRYLLGKPPRPFDLLYWNADSSNLPAAMYSYYLRNMYMENNLYKPGGITLDNVDIDLSSITTPTFFLGSETDHITLWKSVYSGLNLLGGDVEFILSESGHVRAVVNPADDTKYGYYINNEYTHAKDYSHSSKVWLEEAEKHEGSWWPFWVKWLEKHDSAKVPARQIIESMIIEDAPGSYVKKRL